MGRRHFQNQHENTDIWFGIGGHNTGKLLKILNRKYIFINIEFVQQSIDDPKRQKWLLDFDFGKNFTNDNSYPLIFSFYFSQSHCKDKENNEK